MAPTARLAVLATALLSLLLLISPQAVSATDTTRLLDFPSCVEQCIKGNGCRDLDSAKCMCQGAAKDNLLAKVVVCMRNGCTAQISPKSAFIDVMRAGCSQLKMPIPDEKVAQAELLAGGQGGVVTLKLPTSTTTSNGAAPTQTRSDSQSSGAQSSSATTTSGESSQSQDRQQPSSTAGVDTSSNPAPTPETTTTTTASQQAANTPRPDPREPTDSSPFATPIEAGVGRMEPPSWVWAAGAVAAIGGLR